MGFLFEYKVRLRGLVMENFGSWHGSVGVAGDGVLRLLLFVAIALSLVPDFLVKMLELVRPGLLFESFLRRRWS